MTLIMTDGFILLSSSSCCCFKGIFCPQRPGIYSITTWVCLLTTCTSNNAGVEMTGRTFLTTGSADGVTVVIFFRFDDRFFFEGKDPPVSSSSPAMAPRCRASSK